MQKGHEFHRLGCRDVRGTGQWQEEERWVKPLLAGEQTPHHSSRRGEIKSEEEGQL